MSLLRLLTTGKTLVGLKKLEQRYHLPGGNALPKFGGKQNPFRATAFPEKIESSSPEDYLVAPELKGAEENGVELEAKQGLRPHDSTPASHGAEPTRAAGLAHAPAEKPSPFRALLLWGRAKKAKPVKGSNARPLVQAELSLDGVKVMRNDLSESDFEIVQRDATVPQRRQAPAAAASTETGCVAELSKQ